jgi:hypothetical protein
MYIEEIFTLNIISSRPHLSKKENTNFIIMPYNITLEDGSHFNCYKTGRNIMEH